jgi:hypothetical protein
MWSYRKHDPVADTTDYEFDVYNECLSTTDVKDGCFVFHALMPIEIEATVKEYQPSTIPKKFNKGRPAFTKSRSVSFAISQQNSPPPVPFPPNSLISVDRVVTFDARRQKLTSPDVRVHPQEIGEDQSESYDSAESEYPYAFKSKEEDTNISKYARLADSSGWIKVYESGTSFCTEIRIETDLFSFYVDNIPLGITCRFHPLDDYIDLVPNELANRTLLLHLVPMTKIYCDLKVVHPISGICFYRLQMSTLSCIPLWVHDRQISDNPSLDPDVYKLLSSEKIVDGTVPDKDGLMRLFAYQVMQGAIVRSKPDCTEESKDFSSIVQKNDILVGNLIRESPMPQNGNGPFIRLTTPYNENLNKYWLFEQKQHMPILKSIPIKCGRWEFQVVLNPSVVDSANETMMMCRAGVFVYTQPLDRCLSTSESTIAFFRVGDFIQCDYKIEQVITEDDNDESDDEDNITLENSQSHSGNNSKKTKINYYYRTMLSDGRYGWVSELDLSDVVQTFRRFRQHQQLQQQYAAKLRLLTSMELEEEVTSDFKDIDTVDSDDWDWTADDVRRIAVNTGVKEIAYQPVGNVLVFETGDFVQIVVFCLTKTVQTSYQHSIDNQEGDAYHRYVERSFSMDSEYTSDIDRRINGRSQMSYNHNDAKLYNCHRKCRSLVDLMKIMKMNMLQMISMTNITRTVDDYKPQNFCHSGNVYENNFDYGEEKKEDSLPIEAFSSTYDMRNNFKHESLSTCTKILPFHLIKDGPRMVNYDEYEITKRRELMECDVQIQFLQNQRMQLLDVLKPFDEWRASESCASLILPLSSSLFGRATKEPIPSVDVRAPQIEVCAKAIDKTINDYKLLRELPPQTSSSVLLDEGFEIINNSSSVVASANMILVPPIFQENEGDFYVQTESANIAILDDKQTVHADVGSSTFSTSVQSEIVENQRTGLEKVDDNEYDGTTVDDVEDPTVVDACQEDSADHDKTRQYHIDDSDQINYRIKEDSEDAVGPGCCSNDVKDISVVQNTQVGASSEANITNPGTVETSETELLSRDQIMDDIDDGRSSCKSEKTMDVEQSGDAKIEIENLHCKSESDVIIDSASSHGEMTRLVSIAVSPSSSTSSHLASPSNSQIVISQNKVETSGIALPLLHGDTATNKAELSLDNTGSLTDIVSIPPTALHSYVPSVRLGQGSIPRNQSSHSYYRTNDFLLNDTKSRGEKISQALPPPFVRSPSNATAKTSCSGMGSRRRGLVCGECFQMFSGKYSRDIHCREIHKLYCRSCSKIFPSKLELNSHRC